MHFKSKIDQLYFLNLPSKKLNDEQRRKKRKQVMSLLNFNTQIKAQREYLMSTTSDSWTANWQIFFSVFTWYISANERNCLLLAEIDKEPVYRYFKKWYKIWSSTSKLIVNLDFLVLLILLNRNFKTALRAEIITRSHTICFFGPANIA